MIGLAVTLLIIASIAAILGFGSIAGAFAEVAVIIFIVALVAGLTLLVLGLKAATSLTE